MLTLSLGDVWCLKLSKSWDGLKFIWWDGEGGAEMLVFGSVVMGKVEVERGMFDGEGCKVFSSFLTWNNFSFFLLP